MASRPVDTFPCHSNPDDKLTVSTTTNRFVRVGTRMALAGQPYFHFTPDKARKVAEALARAHERNPAPRSE